MRHAFLFLARGLASVVLLASALLHLANPYEFLGAVYAYRLGPADLGTAAAALLPFAQLTAALQLWLPRSRSAGWLLASLLFILYSVAQASALWRGLDISCGCFGAHYSGRVGGASLALVASLAGLALAGLAWDRPGAPRESEASHVPEKR